MKTLADLDRTHRLIPSHLIRQMTSDRIGQMPHNHLWRDMRQCAGIQPKQRRLTQLEAIRLIAVTVTHQETGQLPTSLVQVNRVASELLNCRGIEDMFSTLQERALTAAELKEAIARVTGRTPSNGGGTDSCFFLRLSTWFQLRCPLGSLTYCSIYKLNSCPIRA